MAAKRCAICSINYPSNADFTNCQACDEALAFLWDAQVDENWPDLVKEAVAESDVVMFAFGLLQMPHKADATATVLEDADGRLWVDHDDLLRAGYSALEPDVIVFLDGEFYELNAFSITRGLWWISHIDPEAEFNDVPVLSENPEHGG